MRDLLESRQLRNILLPLCVEFKRNQREAVLLHFLTRQTGNGDDQVDAFNSTEGGRRRRNQDRLPQELVIPDPRDDLEASFGPLEEI